MDITFLGTAAAYPSPHRGVSCTVYRNEGALWMFDCGEGSQMQIMKSSLRPGKITKVFITHLHGDHLYGLPGLMCTIGHTYNPDSGPVEFYGPTGLRRYLRETLTLSRSILGFQFVVHELVPSDSMYRPGWKRWTPDHTADASVLHPNETMGNNITADEDGTWHLCEDEKHVVKAGALVHWVPTFGFVIQERPMPGRLDIKKVKEFGIKPGPLCAKLKAGESVEAPDGKIINAADVLGPEREGRKIVILGDTCDNSGIAHLCQGATAVVHEATLSDDMEADAMVKTHSTPSMAARFCKEINAKMLILTHFSQRYKPLNQEVKDDEESVQVLLDQGKAAFGDNVVAAEDLLTVTIPAPK